MNLSHVSFQPGWNDFGQQTWVIQSCSLEIWSLIELLFSSRVHFCDFVGDKVAEQLLISESLPHRQLTIDKDRDSSWQLQRLKWKKKHWWRWYENQWRWTTFAMFFIVCKLFSYCFTVCCVDFDLAWSHDVHKGVLQSLVWILISVSGREVKFSYCTLDRVYLYQMAMIVFFSVCDAVVHSWQIQSI